MMINHGRIPTQNDVDVFLAALPASTINQIIKRTGFSRTKITRIKTYLNHHPELGYTISASTTGDPNFLNENRHQLITEDSNDLPTGGLSAYLHQGLMRTRGSLNEMIARLSSASEEERKNYELMLSMLQTSVKLIEEAERKIG